MPLGSTLEELHSGPAAIGRTESIELRGYDRLILTLRGTYEGRITFKGTVSINLEEAEWFTIGLRPSTGGGVEVEFLDKTGVDELTAFTLLPDLAPLSGFCLELNSATGTLDAWVRKGGS